MSDAVEPIPQEVLEAARLKLKRKIAAVLIYSMAEAGLTLEQADTRLGRKPGYTMRYLNRLVSGLGKDLDVVSDMATALGCEVRVSLQPYPEAIAEVVAAEETPND